MEANATAATPAAPTGLESANGSGVIPSLEERSAAAFGSDESAVEGGQAASSSQVDPSAAVSPEPDANAKARAERRAQYQKLKEEERARVDAMAAIRERDELRQKLAALEGQAKAQPANVVDIDSLDEEKFYSLAEKAKINPTRFYEWLRERMANPELAAAQAATRAVDPKLSALEKQNAELRERLDAWEQQQRQAAEEAQERQYAEQFFAFTRENAGTSPHSARFLEKFGADEFYKLAQRAAPLVPPGAGAQAILDEIEERLSQVVGGLAAETAVPQRRQASPTHQNTAAAQAPIHVSNSLAQQRSSVIDEDDNWAALPFEERSARVFR